MRLLSLLRRPRAAGSRRGPGSDGIAPDGAVASDAVHGPAGHWREHEELQRVREEVERTAAGGMTHDDGARMEAFIAALGLPRFPVGRDELVERARAHEAREAVIVDLRSLPDGARFGSMVELLHALGVGSAGRVDTTGTEGNA